MSNSIFTTFEFVSEVMSKNTENFMKSFARLNRILSKGGVKLK